MFRLTILRCITLWAAGDDEQRLFLLSTWRKCSFYSDRERAAVAWAKALTLITEDNVPDGVFRQARAQFSEDELVKFPIAIVAINDVNRINVAFRPVPGSYRAKIRAAAE